MRRNELVHHEHYVAKVQQDLTHFLLNDESLKNGAIKYLRWDNEMKLFDVYDDAEHKVFITHTFYERFRDIQLAKGIVCQRCGRKLKDTKWTPIGYGRRCYKKFLKEEWERNQMTIFDFIEDEMYDACIEQEMEEADAGRGRLMFLHEQHEQNFAAITEQYKFDIVTESDLIVAYITAVPDVYEKVSGASLAYDSWLLDEQFATEQSDTFNALLGVALSYRLGVEPSKLRAYEQMLDGPYWVVVALGAADIYTNGMFNTLKSMEVL